MKIIKLPVECIRFLKSHNGLVGASGTSAAILKPVTQKR